MIARRMLAPLRVTGAQVAPQEEKKNPTNRNDIVYATLSIYKHWAEFSGRNPAFYVGGRRKYIYTLLYCGYVFMRVFKLGLRLVIDIFIVVRRIIIWLVEEYLHVFIVISGENETSRKTSCSENALCRLLPIGLAPKFFHHSPRERVALPIWVNGRDDDSAHVHIYTREHTDTHLRNSRERRALTRF